MSQNVDVVLTKEMLALTIKDRLNFPYLIARQIITYQQAILTTEHSEREIQEAINGLVELVPDSWKGEEWKKETKEAKIKRKIDIRPIVAGNIRMSEEVCKELGIPAFREEEGWDSNKLFHCVINLLDRRGLISRKTKYEDIPGEPFNG